MDVIERFKNRKQLSKEITVEIEEDFKAVFSRMPAMELRLIDVELRKGLSTEWCDLTIRKFKEHFISAKYSDEGGLLELTPEDFAKILDDLSVTELIELTGKYRGELRTDQEGAEKNGCKSARDSSAQSSAD